MHNHVPWCLADARVIAATLHATGLFPRLQQYTGVDLCEEALTARFSHHRPLPACVIADAVDTTRVSCAASSCERYSRAGGT